MPTIEKMLKQRAERQRQRQIQKQIQSQVLGPIASISKQLKTYETAIKNTSLSYFEKYIKQVANFLENIEKSGDLSLKSQAWLVENGWPPLMHVAWNAPIQVMNHCIEENLNKKDIANLLEKEIVECHNSKMIEKEILTSWNSHFVSKQRMKILKSAVHAHFERKYELSVPVFISQIEGIPQAYFNYSNQKFSKKLCSEYFIPKDSSSQDEFMEIFFRYLTDTVFVSGKGEDELLDINRNKILHGEYTNYAKESASLKLILIIDILLTYPKFVSFPRAKVYHVPHCPSFKRAKKNNKKTLRIIHTEMSAKASGLKPCKRCLGNENLDIFLGRGLEL